MSSFSGNNSTALAVATGEGNNTLAYAYATADTPDMYASFSRSSSQFMSTGNTTLNIATNGGFTAIAYVRFTGTAGGFERVFEFASGTPNDNVVLSRNNVTTQITFGVNNGTSGIIGIFAGTIVQNEWTLVTCRYTVSTALAQLYQNGVLVGTQSSVTPITNRTTTTNYIGRSNYGSDAYTNMDLKGLVVYDRSLTDAEIALCTDILTGTTGGALLPPANLKYILTARTLRYANNSLIATWGSYSQGTSANQPVFVNPSLNHVSFSAGSSHFMSAPSTTFNISTNGGFTAVCFVRFPGTAGSFERIFDFGNGSPSNNIILSRQSTTSQFSFSIYNSSTPYTALGGTIVQNAWTLIAVRYIKSTGVLQLYQDNLSTPVVTTSSVPTLIDRILVNNYIARSNWIADAYATIDLMGLIVYDRNLTDAEMTLCSRIVRNEYGPNVLPATPIYTLVAKPLLLCTAQPVSTWGVFTQPTTANQPTYKRSILNWIGLGSSIFSSYAHDAKYARNRWVAGGIGTSNTLAYSNDGITWIGLGKTLFDSTVVALANSPTTWVAAGSLNNSLANSSDGVNWNPLGSVLLETGTGVAYNTLSSQWLTVGNPAFKPPYASFSRASSQHLSANAYGTIPLNISTNGGFTAVAYVRFTGTAGAFERVFEFANGTPSDNISLNRNNVTTQLNFAMNNGSSGVYNLLGGTIVQNAWTIVTCRYTASTTSAQLFQDGSQVTSGTTATLITNRNTTINYVGRSAYSSDAYSNIDLIGLFVFDRSLNNTEIAQCQDILRWRVPPSSIPYGAVVTLFPQYFIGASASSKVVYWDGMVSYTASSLLGSDWAPQMAFDGNTGTGWHTADPVYNGSTGVYTGSAQTLVSGINISGEWLQIRLPLEQRVQVDTITITPRAEANLYLYRSPNTFVVAGSNDGTTWTTLASFAGISWPSSAAQTFTVSTPVTLNMTSLNQTQRNYFGMTTNTSNTTVYVAHRFGFIYKFDATGTLVTAETSPTSREWMGMTYNPVNGNVYCCVFGGDIYQQVGGTGNFVALGQTSRDWVGMACNPANGDVYCCVFGGDIYRQTGGTGNFVALGQTSRNWYGMTVLSGNIYASVASGDIYRQTGGTGAFVPLGQPPRSWSGMTTVGNNVYCCVESLSSSSDIYVQYGGQGHFVALGQSSRYWHGITSLGNTLYASTTQVTGQIYSSPLPLQTYSISSSFPVRFIRLITQVVGNSNLTLAARSSVQIMEMKINSSYPSYQYVNYTTSQQPTLQYETSALNSLRTNMAFSLSPMANVWTYNTLSPFTNTATVYSVETATLSVPSLVSDGLVANFDTQNKSCYPGSGRDLLSVVGSVDTTPGLVSYGLNAYFNPNNPKSYSGSGATLNSLVGSATGTLLGTYFYANGAIRLTNTTGSSTTNTSILSLSTINNIRSISMWVYIFTGNNSIWRYWLDDDTSSLDGELANNEIGNYWNNQFYYINNGNVFALTQTSSSNLMSTTGQWMYITFVGNTAMIIKTLFGRTTNDNGLDCAFGPIQIYNRVLTRAEHIQNFYAPEHAYLCCLVKTSPINTPLYQQPFLGLTADTSNGYIASASSVQSTFSPFYAFDLKSGDYTASNYNFWHCADPRYNSTTGSYTGSVSTVVSGLSVSGEWLQIQLPYAIILKSFTITPRRDAVFDQRSPNDFVIAGSNDGATWFSVFDTAGSITWIDEIPRSFIVPNSSIAYQYYRLITRVCGNAGTINRTSVIITEWTLNQVFVSTGRLYGSYYVNADWSIRLPNTSSVDTQNLSNFQVGTLPIRTVSMWVFVFGLNPIYQYFVDARSGGTSGYITINVNVGDIGTDWINGTYYLNGGAATSLTNANFYATINGNLNRWIHLTFVANSTLIDDPCFFGRFTQLEGLNCTFRSILIYDRVLSQSENTQNYNSFFGTHWVAGAEASSGHSLAWSSDGFWWTGLGTSIFGNYCFGIGWNGKIWVAVGRGDASSNSVATSTDGKTWNGRGYPAGMTVGRRVVWTGAYWVIAGEGANTLALSYDGIDWIPIIAPNTAVFGTRGLGVGSNFSVNDS